MSEFDIHDFGLVLVAGVPSQAKTEFLSTHFLPSEVVSLQAITAMVQDDDGIADSPRILEIMESIVDARLEQRRVVAVDAPLSKIADRSRWVSLAAGRFAEAVIFVLEVPPETENVRWRSEYDELRKTQSHMVKEDFKVIHGMKARDLVDVAIKRAALPCDLRSDVGPFDIVGDVHGCADELEQLLAELGYVVRWSGTGPLREVGLTHPQGRRLIFVGDIVDRGPRVADCLRIVMAAVAAGGYCVSGNHDDKLRRWFDRPTIKQTHGLDVTVADIEAQANPAFDGRVKAFLESLPVHLWLDEGRLVVAHAGIKQSMIGRQAPAVREFCLFGETDVSGDGEFVRVNWAKDYIGDAAVVYGHTPTRNPKWVNNTICVDAGCVFGGNIIALQWPERRLVSVPAKREYWPFSKSFIGDDEASQKVAGVVDELDRRHLTQERVIETALMGPIRIDPRLARKAYEATAGVVDPGWLSFVPSLLPTIPVAGDGGLAMALGMFTEAGDRDVVVERVLGGAEAIFTVQLCTGAHGAPLSSSGIGSGMISDKFGRPLLPLDDREVLLDRLAIALDRAGVFEALSTDWLIIEGRLFDRITGSFQARSALDDLTVFPRRILAYEGHVPPMESADRFFDLREALSASPEFRSGEIFFPRRLKGRIGSAFDSELKEKWERLEKWTMSDMVVWSAGRITFQSGRLGQSALRVHNSSSNIDSEIVQFPATSKTRSISLRQFALGMEGLRRFVARRPMVEIHECVLASLSIGLEAGNEP